MSWPANVTRPDFGGSSPAIERSSVDFPAPFVPSSASISPSATAVSMPNSTWSEPYDASTPSHAKMGDTAGGTTSGGGWPLPPGGPLGAAAAPSAGASSSTTGMRCQRATTPTSRSRTLSNPWARPPGRTMRMPSRPTPAISSWDLGNA
jgi:hypothetical protein